MTSSILLKKQEEQNARLLRDLLRLPENKKCFDCPTKSPFFVNTTLQTFICTRCSGLVREVGHRVKSISASIFTGPEIAALELGGNGIASKIWLSCGYNTSDTPEPESDGEVRAFMRQKYFERKWLNRDLAVSHDQAVKQRIHELFTEEGMPRQQARRRRATIENKVVGGVTLEGHRLKNIPKPLDLTSTHSVQQPTIQTAPLIMTSHQPQPNLPSCKQSNGELNDYPPPVSSVTNAPTSYVNAQQQTSRMDSFFADLTGLTLSSPSPTQSTPMAPTATRRSCTLIPTSSYSLAPKVTKVSDVSTYNRSYTSIPQPGSMDSGHSLSPSSQLQSTDPYSALRAHHAQEQLRHEQMRSAIASITQSTKHLEQAKKQDSPTDPYATLRQMSFGSESRAPTTPTPFSPSWSTPTPQPSQQQPYSSTTKPAPFDHKSHHSKMTREWVETQPFVPDIDDEDLMAQLSTTSSQSTSSSKSRQTTTKSKPGNDDVFGDLDPLVNYKRNKITAPSK